MKLNDMYINYLEYGLKKGKTIVLLHGWGQNIEMMKPIGDYYQTKYRVIIVDLPGHGQSSEPSIVLTVPDYVKIVNDLLKKLKVNNPIIIGHSFGGKIGLLYSSMYDVEDLILLGSPFKKSELNNSIKTKFLKAMKKVPIINKLEHFAKKHIGSSDYRSASPIMREILVGTIGLDISHEVKKIKAPTLLIWGTNDQAVSVDDAKELETLIPNAGLILIEGASHYAYLEHLSYVLNVIDNLIEGEKKC